MCGGHHGKFTYSDDTKTSVFSVGCELILLCIDINCVCGICPANDCNVAVNMERWWWKASDSGPVCEHYVRSFPAENGKGLMFFRATAISPL
jgi:hypothetical protein